VGKRPTRWYPIIWGILGFMMFLSGFLSENVVMKIVLMGQAFAATSIYLTSYVEGEHRVKKALEVVSALVALEIVVYGYVITGSLILGVLTLFIAAMVIFAFVTSYFLPRIRRKYGTAPV